ncbi:hypothetical protein CTI14_60790, partial [Methylobacterium radiotolerans]
RALAAGCAGSAPSGEGDGPVEITYWLWQDDATDPTWTELADEFNGARRSTHHEIHPNPPPPWQPSARALAAGCAGSAPSGEGDGPVEITYWLWQDDATD